MPVQQQHRPQEQVEQKDALAQSPEDQARQQKATEVKDKYGDDSFLEKGKEKAEITPEQARDTLSDPAKLSKFLKEFEQSRMKGGKEGQMRMIKPEHVVREMLDLVKTDTDFMKKVIETYATGEDSENGYVCNNAIERIDLIDDKFFKGVFEKSDDYYIRSEAVRKITDQSFLRGVVEEYRKKGDIGADSEGAVALENISDQAYLSEIALDQSVDNMMRERAIGQLTDKGVLEQFASISDEKADQYLYESGSDEQHQAFLSSQLRNAARDRLKSLEK